MRAKTAGHTRSAKEEHRGNRGCHHGNNAPNQHRHGRPHRANLQTMQSPRRLLLLLLTLLSVAHIPPQRPRTTPPAAWNHDYEARLHHARLRGRPPPRPLHIRWLHIPKTGTSFANTLIRWGCPTVLHPFIIPRKERPQALIHPIKPTHSWDWLFLNNTGRSWLRLHCTPRLAHFRKRRVLYALYMHKPLHNSEVHRAVGLFRIPLQRVYSNYLHLSHHYNESTAPRESLTTFVARKQFSSQQAKLLLGRHYRDERVVTQREANQAAQTLQSMLFVGLTEHFQLSCRLFHAMFGGVPHRAQFENVRPGIRRYRHHASRQPHFRYDELAFQGWRDHADDVVYLAACNRFWLDVRRYKIEIEKDGLGQVQIPPQQPS